MVKFLKFVKTDLSECEQDYQDDFVKSLQEAIQRIKHNRQREERYMLLELEIQRERREAKAEGKAEGVLEFLDELGTVPEELREVIMQEQDLDVLKKWLRLAAKSESMEEFRSRMRKF